MKPFRILFLVLISLVSCTTYKPILNHTTETSASSSPIEYTVYLIGDAGKSGESYNTPVLTALKKELDDADKNNAVIFLGDNIYPTGMPYETDPYRKEAEKIIKEQIKTAKKFKGKTIVLPGNHDWEEGGLNGFYHNEYQEKYVNEYFDDEVYLPGYGCPGPEEIQLSEDVVLLVLNTQWFLHKNYRPFKPSICDGQDEAQVISLLHDAIDRNQHKKVIVAAHHPLMSFGQHNGAYGLKDHLFPLTALNKSLYLPLPIIGSIYPLYRSAIGDIQDIPNIEYHEMVERIESALAQHPNIIYAAGHEHNLQYIPMENIHYVISGSGSKKTPLRNSKKLSFGVAETGYSKINVHENGDVRIQYIVSNSERTKIAFETTMFTMPKMLIKPAKYDIDFSDSVKVISADLSYDVNGITRFFMGDNYREEWSTPIEVPYFDIDTEHGGLTIIKKGGGNQTKSLRLQDANGQQYQLRTINKYGAGAISENLRGTFAQNAVQDGISSSFPYGAYPVPVLAEAANVYHTNPKLVYVADDPRLGRYKDIFKGTICLLEERAAKSWPDLESFGGSEKIISTTDMSEKLIENTKNQVDQNWLVRSRMFDILIGDWDRHEDQWRWAKFDEGDFNIYRPIPRDRDQAFYDGDGIVPWISSRKWIIPKTRGFENKVQFLKGLTNSARNIDRAYLNELSWDEWKTEVEFIQNHVTDDVIDQAMLELPNEIMGLSADKIKSKLKVRRADLMSYAQEMYHYVSKEIEIVGSDKIDLFEIERLGNNQVKITGYDSNKDGEKNYVFYERVIHGSETNKVRIFGMDGSDIFIVKGEGAGKPRVDIIAGLGKDEIRNEMDKKPGKIKLLDHPDDFKMQGKTVATHLSKKGEIARLERKDFRDNVTIPTFLFGANPDDGFFIGGGPTILTHGFRKEPHATKQTIAANYAFKTGSYNFKYDGHFTEVLGPLNVGLKVDLNAPNFTTNFFGFGNNTKFNQDLDEDLEDAFYDVRYEKFSAKPFVDVTLKRVHTFALGGAYEKHELVQDVDEVRFIDSQVLVDSTIADGRTFVGGFLSYTMDSRNSQTHPQSGLVMNLHAQPMFENNGMIDFTRLHGNLAIYLTPRLPLETTIAARVGGVINEGEDVPFYYAAYLGGQRNLRGYRQDRYAGQSSFYQNTDLRIKLANLNGFIINGEFGLLGFHDIGRVYLDDDDELLDLDKNKMHTSYGGGIWLRLYDMFVINSTYAIGDEEELITVKLGWLY